MQKHLWVTKVEREETVDLGKTPKDEDYYTKKLMLKSLIRVSFFAPFAKVFSADQRAHRIDIINQKKYWVTGKLGNLLGSKVQDATTMDIKGFIDLSMVDWDDKVSAVIFLPRCNFRCPFCYNVALVLTPDELPTIPFEKIESYLERHKEGIEGVVITGGEPTVHNDLPYLCRRLKNMGFMVKLDTNGTGPSMIKELIEDSLVDYVAMDVKAPLTEEKYSRATGVNAKGFLKTVEESMNILMESGVDYEFRTTVVPTIHTEEDIKSISKALGGCRRYVLQNFKSEVKMIDPSFENLKPFSKEEMETFLVAARTYVKQAKIRG